MGTKKRQKRFISIEKTTIIAEIFFNAGFEDVMNQRLDQPTWGGGAKVGYSLNYTVKKGKQLSRTQPWCPLPNSPWAGIIKFFPARESLVSDIPAGDGKTDNFFLQCTVEDPADVRAMEKERAAANKQLDLIHWMLAVAEFIDPWLGDKINSGMAGVLQQPYAGVDFIPQSGIYEFGYSSEIYKRNRWYVLVLLRWLQVAEGDLH